MVVAEALAPPPLVVDRLSTDVLTLMVPLFVSTMRPLPPRPVDVISPAPVIVLPADEEVSRMMPPLAVTAPATAILLLFVMDNVPLPSVIEVTESARPD